jgi:DNA topoisomerase-1
VVEFDFLGKDSIRYQNKVPVEKAVFKNLKLFKEDKGGSDDLFDRLDVSLFRNINSMNNS